MKVAILHNPRSGRNRAESLAIGCATLLRERGHEPLDLVVGGDNVDAVLHEAERLIIVGGDGTVHHTLDEILEHQTPFVHLPTGTANLIAKEFGMPKDPHRVVEWIERAEPEDLDVPRLDGEPFLIMVNAGADASVIHRFEHARRGSGGYLNYVIPVTKEVFSPRPARFKLEIDGNDQQIRTPANLTIANMRSSALAINPCHGADPTDGLLDTLVTPCARTLSWTLATWLLRARITPPKSARARAVRVTIEALEDCVVQFDGEIARTPSMPEGVLKKGDSIHAECRGESVPVLTLGS